MDNLDKADGSPNPDIINAKWTFNNLWDPVSVLNNFYNGN